MKILKFKTDIHNEEELANVAPMLNEEKMISKWKLDLASPEKVLSVSGEEVSPDIVTRIFKENGFQAEPLHVLAIGGHDL